MTYCAECAGVRIALRTKYAILSTLHTYTYIHTTYIVRKYAYKRGRKLRVRRDTLKEEIKTRAYCAISRFLRISIV